MIKKRTEIFYFRMLAYFLGRFSIKPNYKIYVQEFDEKNNKTIFKLGRAGEAKPLIKTAEEIWKDKNLLKVLSSEDAYRVGYAAAFEMR